MQSYTRVQNLFIFKIFNIIVFYTFHLIEPMLCKLMAYHIPFIIIARTYFKVILREMKGSILAVITK